jgi:predicted deacetylase
MLLVSIHDVTPALQPNVIRLWDLCSRHGLAPALLVVPNWHGRWPLEEHSSFIDWIRARAGEGAEVVLHGERHDEMGLPRTLWESCRAWGKTDGEGEFLSLDAAAARDRLNRALQRLRKLGLEPTGFVPPAWLAGEATHQAAAAAGLRFTEDTRCIRLLSSGQQVKSPVVRWSARTPMRAWGSAAVAGARWTFQRSSAWPRIALHPGDLDHEVTARSIGRTLERWLRRHRPGHYADLTDGFQPL